MIRLEQSFRRYKNIFPVLVFKRSKTEAAHSSIPVGSFFIVEECITTDEENYLISELNPIFSKKRYQGNHWDDVIYKYKESQIVLDTTSFPVRMIFERLMDTIKVKCNKPEISMLAPHVIDLHKDGSIAPHVDSIKFSGDIVAGLSLLSTRQMRLTLDPEQPQRQSSNYSLKLLPSQIDVLLRPRSLYILTGPLRYQYAHAVLGKKNNERVEIESDTKSVAVVEGPFSYQLSELDRRLSVIFRDAKSEKDNT